MAIYDELTEQEIKQNKAIRGYIVRALAKGSILSGRLEAGEIGGALPF